MLNLTIKHTSEKSKGIAEGFAMTFENGYTISVQIGFGNYCDNRHEAQPKPYSKTAEVAIFTPSGEFYEIEGDYVCGYCNTDKIADLIALAKSL